MNKNLLVALLCSCALISVVQAESKPNESKEPVSGRIAFLGKAGTRSPSNPAAGVNP